METADVFQTSPIQKVTSHGHYRVLVLHGGWTLERDMSLESGRGIINALKTLGHSVEAFDPPRNLQEIVKGICNSFDGSGPEVIFNMLLGGEGEGGTIHGVIELLGIPYTSSGVHASAAAIHKGFCRSIMKDVGISCPPGRVMSLQEYKDKGWSYPHIVKAPLEGSSISVSFVDNNDKRNKVISNWSYGEDILVEDYIPGREVKIAVYGGRAMGAKESTFKAPIYDYQTRYTKGAAQHTISPTLPPDVSKQMHMWAELAHKTLHCRGITVTDFRYNPDAPVGNQVYFLEINTQPGFTENSSVPHIAKHYDWSFADCVAFVLDEAIKTRL
ncbi:unnamed protein product [Meganyctiphanes norvegica]|uniref:ATP-grasp domain-containing protein n=1 Tax=Meganyctiphanes norvegica TaxID=48144 RepID=A0AAV2RT38_MEGNR